MPVSEVDRSQGPDIFCDAAILRAACRNRATRFSLGNTFVFLQDSRERRLNPSWIRRHPPPDRADGTCFVPMMRGTDYACFRSSSCLWAASTTFAFSPRWPCRRFAGLFEEIGMGNHGHPTPRSFTSLIRAHASSDASCADPYACPMCGKRGLIRIRRRVIDRIVSVFVRLRRFRCTHSGCEWEGNLRERTSARREQGPHS